VPSTGRVLSVIDRPGALWYCNNSIDDMPIEDMAMEVLFSSGLSKILSTEASV